MSNLVKFGGNRFMPSFFDDDFFNNFFEGYNRDLPATNVTETKDNYKVELSVPGLDKDKFNVEVKNNVLTISCNAEDSYEEKDKDDKVIRREFKSTSFSRSFALPENVDADKINAEHQNGILILTIPKAEKAIDEVKKIDIK